jgi:putative tryptophan/tyrosine transport system substrate-binding protein
MRRRSLIGGLMLAALVRPAWAKEPRISILHSGFPLRTPTHLLVEALRSLGYEDGRTASVEVLGAEGDAARLKSLVADLVSKPPDLIIAITAPAVLALKDKGAATPVVFLFVPDPIALGIVVSLAHPGGNFTGITYSESTLGGKRLDLLLDAIPGTQRVALIWSRRQAENAALVDAVRRTAEVRGVEIFVRAFQGAEDLGPAFDEAVAARAQALIFLPDNQSFGRRKENAALALAHHLPSMHSFQLEVEDGGLMAYGPSLEEGYRRAAALADRILKGTRPADLPVEEPTRLLLSINLKTARAFGLTIPPSLLARADEVIE